MRGIANDMEDKKMKLQIKNKTSVFKYYRTLG